MQIPLGNATAEYPQPYATWAAIRDDADGQGGVAVVDASADDSAQETMTPAYTVDISA
jgi:hypothetical protein